jgi:hypothetical protein
MSGFNLEARGVRRREGLGGWFWRGLLSARVAVAWQGEPEGNQILRVLSASSVRRGWCKIEGMP